MFVIAAALAAPLSTEIESAQAELTTLDAERCSPVLDGLTARMRALDTIDAEDAADHGRSMVTDLFDARVTLQERLAVMHDEGTLTPSCITSARHADLEARTLGDRLFQATPGFAPLVVAEGVEMASLTDLRSGDVLVTRGNGLSSAGISKMYAVDSQFSHNALVYIDGDGEAHTIEAYLERGTITQPLTELLHHDLGRVVVMRHTDPVLAAEAARRAYERVSAGPFIPYDDRYDHNDASALFCSEVPGWAYGTLMQRAVASPPSLSSFPLDANPSLFAGMNLDVADNPAPADVLFDPRFEMVAEWRDVAILSEMHRQDAIVTTVFSWMEDDGYIVEPTAMERVTVDGGMALRRTPVLGGLVANMVSKENDKGFLVTSLALQNTGIALEEALVGVDDPAAVEAELLRLRAEDLALWERGERSRFHQSMHPAPTDGVAMR